LAIEIGSRLKQVMAGGIWFSDLSDVVDPGAVPEAIANSLGLRSHSRWPAVDIVRDHLRDRSALLIVDNCEHVIAAAADVCAALLQQCPNLRVLATSRERLRVPGELVFQVPPLSLPDARNPNLTIAAASDAVSLFVERAKRAREGFELVADNVIDVVQICRRLSGLPLAIELVAARLSSFTTADLAIRLSDALVLKLEGSRIGPARQRTLGAAVAWSYELLDVDEQAMFRQMAVFVGGCDLVAAETVCDTGRADPGGVLMLVSGLVEKSLLVAEGSRYRLLEAVRPFALQRLVEAGEESPIRAIHARHFASLVDAGQGANPFDRADLPAWLERIEVEIENMRVTLDWYLNHEPEKALGLTVGLDPFWRLRGFSAEGRRWIELCLAAAPEVNRARLRALDALSAMATVQRDYVSAAHFSDDLLALARALGEPGAIASALLSQAGVKLATGDVKSARTLVDEADKLLTRGPEGFEALFSNRIRGIILALTGHLDEARPLLEEGVRLSQELNYLPTIPFDLAIIGAIAMAQGDLSAARVSALKGIEICRIYGSRRDVIYCLDLCAGIAAAEGEHARAVKLFAANAAIKESTREEPPAVWQSIAARWLEPANRALGEEAAAEAWTSGRDMSFHEVLEDVLSEHRPRAY
jgi:predicted ATPase